MSGCVLDTVNTLKSITGDAKFNGLAFIVLSKKAWYVCDLGAVDTADDNNVIMPDDGIGRWIKCNNDSNILNGAVTLTTVSNTTTIDFSNIEQLQLIFNQDTAITFPVNIRNGYGYLILNRNGGSWNITSWDNRVKFSSESYNFNNGINIAIMNLIFFNNVIYVSKTTEYV